MGDVVKLIMADIFQPLAARFELLVDLDGFLGHLLMRAFGAADEREVRSGGETFVAVGIQSDTHHDCFAFA